MELTAKEFDLMELLMRNPGRVYSRENLLNVVWGYEYVGDYRTVDVHVRRLREKLELDPANPEYILTKWGVGYYLSNQTKKGLTAGKGGPAWRADRHGRDKWRRKSPILPLSRSNLP